MSAELVAGITTLETGRMACHECRLLMRATEPSDEDAHAALICPRCGARVHPRKPDSIPRTWAFLLAALIFYAPANVYPVMEVTSLGRTQEDTILSGVLFLLSHGMWPLAGIVFVASVVVPLAKILALGMLAFSVQRRWSWRPAERTRAYRITETVGRWSMVDIYVVTILVALVHLGSLATVVPRAGAFFFAGVVVLTMLAAESFDPRLIWDVAPRATAGSRSPGAVAAGADPQ